MQGGRKLEIDSLKLPIGKQDQFAATYGGLNIIKFKSNGKTIVQNIKNKKIINFLKKNLVIIIMMVLTYLKNY